MGHYDDIREEWEEEQKRKKMDSFIKSNYLFALINDNKFKAFKKEFIEQAISIDYKYEKNSWLSIAGKLNATPEFHQFLIKAGCKIKTENLIWSLGLKIPTDLSLVYLKNFDIKKLNKNTKKDHLILKYIIDKFIENDYQDSRLLDWFFANIDLSLRNSFLESLFSISLGCIGSNNGLSHKAYFSEEDLKSINQFLPHLIKYNLNPLLKNRFQQNSLEIFKDYYKDWKDENQNYNKEKIKVLSLIIKQLENYHTAYQIDQKVAIASNKPVNKL